MTFPFLLFNLTILAQSELVELKVGEMMDDLKLNNITNWHSSSARLSDFKGKCIILDFWASWCGSCIAALPKLNQLQEKYADRLQILVITSDKLTVIEKERQRLQILKNNRLPIVYADSILNKLFPHKSIPHEIWIDKHGYVKAITSDDYVIEENVEKLLTGADLSVPQKKDFLKFKTGQPLTENLKIADTQPSKAYTSVFTSYLPGAPTAQGLKENVISITRYYINQNILSLYSEVTDQNFFNKLVIEVRDTGRIIKTFSNTKDWQTDNLFCYEITVPKETSPPEIQELMKVDLDKHLHLKINTELRDMPCWEISIIKQLPISKDSEGSGIRYSANGQSVEFRNIPLAQFIEYLDRSYYLTDRAPIFVEGSPYSGVFSCDIPSDLIPAVNPELDITQLSIYLKKLGIEMNKTTRKIKVAVLTETNR